MPQLQVFLSESLDPHLNLATEEWIFHSLDPSVQTLFLWRNDRTVVIGRNQNPWAECNLAGMKEDGVTLARRTTGGGAVFHDLGNTNFTFLSPRDNYRKEFNIRILLRALQNLGIQAEASGRNDLTVSSDEGPRKFSGSAYREKKDRAFHHGTLLLRADLSQLGRYLTPHPKKLKAKGKESVRARVMNLSEAAPHIDHEAVVQSLIQEFENFHGGKATLINLNLVSLQEIPELKKQYEHLSSWDWLYGQTLEFNHQLDHYLSLGFFDFHFQVEEGRVRALQIFTDCLDPALVESLRQGLLGQVYSAQGITSVFASLKNLYPEASEGLEEIFQWLSQKIET